MKLQKLVKCVTSRVGDKPFSSVAFWCALSARSAALCEAMVSDAFARASLAFRGGDFTSAAAAYSEALSEAEGAEERAKALVNRALCHMRQLRFRDGRDDAAVARTLMPLNAKAWYRLGQSEASLGHLAEAETALTESEALLPCDRDVANALDSVRRRQQEASGRYVWIEVYAKYLALAPSGVHGCRNF